MKVDVKMEGLFSSYITLVERIAIMESHVFCWV